MLKNLLLKLYRVSCTVLGMQKEIIKPRRVEMVNGNLIVFVTESNKRHLYAHTWEQFSNVDLKKTAQVDREKLGIAAGKAIAKNLIVSFDEIKTVRQSPSDA